MKSIKSMFSTLSQLFTHTYPGLTRTSSDVMYICAQNRTAV